MNIAVVIGVSKYINAENLPGSKNDAEAIFAILQKTQKFSHILCINNNESSARTKELITNFVLDNKANQIEELFFYFSGHGDFLNEDFYFILSDFDSKKRKQSSLQNSEMDDLIRTLSPKLVIKIIDACQSGTAYIKDSNILTKYFHESKKTFNKCYFLNSSLVNQSSYQDKDISFFTYSFIKALKEHNSNEIRYKDIIDVISDEFADNSEQTPFFVIQADLTEKFCTFSSELREYLGLFNSTAAVSSSLKTKPLSLSELVKQEAKEYVDKEGAINALHFIEEKFSTIKLNDELAELYTLEVSFIDNYVNVPKKNDIAQWIINNKGEYFAIPIYVEQYDDETGEEYSIITGFNLKIEAPYKVITINVLSIYPNTLSYLCTVVFLLSKRMIRFFYFVTNYEIEGWEERNLNGKAIQWITMEQKISDKSELSRGIETIVDSIQRRVKTDIENKFKHLNPDAKVEDD
jgi:hypothetical protein